MANPIAADALKDQSKFLVDLKTAAAALSMSEKAMRYYVAEGTIPSACLKRIGRRIYLVREQLEKWATQRC